MSYGNTVLRIAAIALLLAAFSGCAAKGAVSSAVSSAPPAVSSQEPVSSAPPPLDRGQRESFDALLQKNPRFIGWMTIPGTKTHDPVVLHTDNSYYLSHTLAGAKNIDGTLFVDHRCKITADYMSQNMTIYGHNLISGRIFGQLGKYKKLDFYKETPVIIFDTVYGNHEWKIFAMFITNTLTKHGEIFNYREPEYESPEAFLEFIKQVRRRSLADCPVDVAADDRIITLSTCSYEITDARFVVMARMVREGEDPSVDVSQARVNPKILYPAGWYRKYGGKMPVYED